MVGILGILLSLGLLIYLAYRGVSALIVAPLMAVVAVLFSGSPIILGNYTQIFMPALGKFAVLYFPLFLLGAIFGKLMEDSGSARVIAEKIVKTLGKDRSILAIVLACAVLTYGGVSLFVVAFAVYPIALAMFQKADIPERLIPATIALGAFTFTMTALPGTPAIQNAIPMPYFDTTPFAAPGVGIIGGAVMFVFGMLWLNHRERSARKKGEGFGQSHEDEQKRPEIAKEMREYAQSENFDVMEITQNDRVILQNMPGFGVAILPVILVILFNFLFTRFVIPAMDTAYLQLPQFGATEINAVRGVWSIICALVLSILILIGFNLRNFPNLKRTLDDGASASVLPLFNTASLVGFGAVVASLPAFELIRDMVLGIAPGNPLISLSIAVNMLAGITGSASGGMSIALQTLGETYRELSQISGINPELMHRVTSIATGGLDSLPQNGAVITLLTICKLTHRQSYGDIFMVAVAVPILALIVVIAIGTIFGSF
ncbi:MAG: GntP family permease [Desulfocapsaceae bacterium]|nr:GntP family permease [Desulfocapsaceae bacterium]